MKRILFVFTLLCISVCSYAQIGHGGRPYSFKKYNLQLTAVPTELMPYQDNAQLLAKEEPNDKTEGYIFGTSISVKITPDNNGIWEELPNGDRLWRVAVKSIGAYSLNLVFDKFYIPSSSSMFIYTADKEYVTGSFTNENNNKERTFATALYPGDEIVIEYYEAATDRDSTEIELSTVVHAYKNMLQKRGTYGSSGSCNIDINCGDTEVYRDIKRAVAIILRYGSAHCTGTLINNTSYDAKPYFLTANHCVDGYLSQVRNFVFVFNYETEYCGSNVERTMYSINGATLKARYAHSDFCLLLLNSTPTQAMQPYYAGWYAGPALPQSVSGIHHPNGDRKKLSTSKGPFYIYKYEDEDDEFPDSTHIGLVWKTGTTEGGSSGSALFNENNLIIGQLEGGYASCNTPNGMDLYGRLFYSWTNNNASDSSQRLDYWLDPIQTGMKTLPGYDPFRDTIDDVSVENYTLESKVEVFPNPANTQVRLLNTNGETYDYIIYNINGQILQQGRNIAENNVIDVADLPNGFYFIKLMTNNKLVRNQKLIIQK